MKNAKTYESLRDFIAALASEGELLRIKAAVSPVLEIAEITDRASKAPGGGKALFFENVEGSSMPVLTNAFGSMKRICMALGVGGLSELAGRLKDILEARPPGSLADKVRLLAKALGWSRFLPRSSRLSPPPCQEVAFRGADVDVCRLPVLHCWPGDGGRFVTLPIVFSKDAAGRRNAGMYRLQVFDGRTLGMHWHIHKDGASHFHEHAAAGKMMEVAVAIGADPTVTYASTAPLPYGVDEMLLAGFIRRRPVRMARCLTVNLEVPSDAEIVLEGYVDPAEERLEGPFGDHTGFYSAADLYPVFHVTALTHRKNAVYQATVVGRPPMEDRYIGLATERLFLPLLQAVLPELVDCRMPWQAVFHNMVLATIEKRYPGQAARVMHGLWGSGQMGLCKAIFVLDAPVDLSKGSEVARNILDTIDPQCDLTLSTGILDVLDHASPSPVLGGKIGVDLTRKLRGEGVRARRLAPTRSAPTRFAGAPRPPPSDAELARLLCSRHPSVIDCRLLFGEAAHPLLLLGVRGGAERGSLIDLLLSPTFIPEGVLSVFFDGPVRAVEDEEALWRAAANVDPGGDIFKKGGRMVIDATAKKGEGRIRPWPEEIKMNRAMGERVSARAEELGIGGMAGLPSSRYV